MAKKNTPIITHTEILVLAIQSAARKIREYDEMVDKCDNMAAREMIAEMRDANVAIWAPKLHPFTARSQAEAEYYIEEWKRSACYPPHVKFKIMRRTVTTTMTATEWEDVE